MNNFTDELRLAKRFIIKIMWKVTNWIYNIIIYIWLEKLCLSNNSIPPAYCHTTEVQWNPMLIELSGIWSWYIKPATRLFVRFLKPIYLKYLILRRLYLIGFVLYLCVSYSYLCCQCKSPQSIQGWIGYYKSHHILCNRDSSCSFMVLFIFGIL